MRAEWDEIQRRLHQAIINPSMGVDGREGLSWIREGAGLGARERLGIYSRAYQGRLLQCMESEFPILRFALGNSLFTRFAIDYLTRYPSQSYSLNDLGNRFPEHLRATRPSDPDELWPNFLIELATLERALVEVFQAPGHESGGSEPASSSEKIAKEPGARSLALLFPVDEYFLSARAHLADPKSNPAPESPAPKPGLLLVYRRNFQIRFRRCAEFADFVGTDNADSSCGR